MNAIILSLLATACLAAAFKNSEGYKKFDDVMTYVGIVLAVVCWIMFINEVSRCL